LNPGGLLLSKDKFKNVQPPAPTLRRVADHYVEWTQACKTGVPNVCPVKFGCEMTALAVLGTDEEEILVPIEDTEFGRRAGRIRRLPKADPRIFLTLSFRGSARGKELYAEQVIYPSRKKTVNAADIAPLRNRPVFRPEGLD